MTAVLAVLPEQAFSGHVPFFILITNTLKIFIPGFRKSVGIDKVVVPSIIGRVNVDHLNLAIIRLLEDFQDFQILAFNKKVAGIVKVNLFFPVGD
ncbi:hypothetical protein BMS3Abin08_01420 [bacterium BMS3Abin08]|nr:hypothetical protein BMS3Abin08_01420 [bacterium BMS3Abin08]